MAPKIVEKFLGVLLLVVAIGVSVFLVVLAIPLFPLKPFFPTFVDFAYERLSEIDWYFLTFLWEKFCRVKLRITGDKLPHHESALIVSNHRTLADWVVILGIAARTGRVGQTMFFQKDVLKYIPGFGWGCYLLGHPFLKREWLRDEKTIEATFKKIKERNLPIYLASYIEGSRFKPERYEMSQEYCKKLGIAPLENVLVPRTKGFVATLNALRDDYVNYVYDVTIQYEGDQSLETYAMRQGCTVHVHLRRYATTSIPREKEAIAKWLFDRWYEKDQMFEHYKKNGVFPGAEISDEMPLQFIHSGLSFEDMKLAAEEGKKKAQAKKKN